MKKNGKKTALLSVICIMAVLYVCYLIGQNVVLPMRNKSYIELEKYKISIVGNVQTTDNPWGCTAGLIEDDEIGKGILLTPNTSFEVCELTSESIVSFQAEIHPWVADSSDGAGIDVWIMNHSGDILKQESIVIDNQKSWIDIQYSLKNYPDATKIKFLCNNGDSGNDNSDWVIFRCGSEYLSSFGKEDYVRSATYFGNEWPINFWNSEMDNLDADLQQIKEDGFNSIILVIPWKEFQVNVNPIEYSEYAFEKLDYVVKTAESHSLDVYIRAGYSWDYYNDLNECITERYLDILRDENTRVAWLEYCSKLYSQLSVCPNFKGGFLTWEDFWGCLAICDNEDENIRREYGKTIGYQKWVESKYSIDEYNHKYKENYHSYEEIPVPLKTEESAMEAMYMFYDEYLNCILRETQEVFPNMSMEVRLDWDGFINSKGKQAYYSHTSTYECENSDYTATMYGIPMGCENKGEKISYIEAINHTEYILENLKRENGGKPIYVEQFLFMDNTPKFSYNAQIKDDEVDDYLEGVSDILLKNTHGYGIWTYRNYINNMVYNSQFALEDLGWQLNGDIYFENDDQSNSTVCIMKSNAKISQAIPEVRDHFPMDKYRVGFDVSKCVSDGKMKIVLGDKEKLIEINSKGRVEIEFERPEFFDIQIEIIEGEVYIDNICLYSFIQDGGLYDVKNNELNYIKSIRILNQELEKN